MKVVYERAAADDLENIYDYIAQRSPHASEQVARRILARIIDSIELLRDFPRAARNGSIEGTRELVVSRLPYIVVYTVEEETDTVTIEAIFHTAQNRPRGG